MTTQIIVENLGKAYRQYKNNFSKIKTILFASKDPSNFKLKWVIKDISFSIGPGEAVGIIGINGAGKSTLLKLITKTIASTQGTISLKGRVAALLELGMGFHPEFTGRQNIYMAGQLIGLSIDEINRKLHEIIEFSEIEEYIDQPVRVYSSGMQVRLAFSVATAIRPDILIIDEALSVGDAYFQHKSFERIRKFKERGTTLLLVSHDKQAIQSICDRAILIASGKKVMEGAPEEVLDHYNALIADKDQSKIKSSTLSGIISDNPEKKKTQLTSGSGEAELVKVDLTDEFGKNIEVVKVGQKVILDITIKAKDFLEELVLGYVIKDRYGREIFGTNTHFLNNILTDIAIGEDINYKFKFTANVGEGNYSISIAAHMGSSHVVKNYIWKDVAIVFNVINADYDTFIGSSWIPPTLECFR
jgi:lipopolysaccharide transport system ATP-binding protein